MAEYVAEYLFDPDLDFPGLMASAGSIDGDVGEIALLFAEHVGAPPMRYVAQCRHRVAGALLRRNDLTAAEGVQVAGFRSVADFFLAEKRPSMLFSWLRLNHTSFLTRREPRWASQNTRLARETPGAE